MTQAIDSGSLPQHYRTAFTRDQTADMGGRTLRFSVVRAGTLALPSGRLVVCDPLVGGRRVPFVQAVLPGRYPVDLSLGFDSEQNLERIAFARLLFTKTDPAVWVKGLPQPEPGVEQSDGFGFVAASGTVALMDYDAADQFKPQTLQQLDHFLDNLVANYKPRRSWLAHSFDDETNAIFFTAADKERSVHTYFAVDDEGDVCLALISLL